MYIIGQMKGGPKGSTTAADITSTASGANHQALDVLLYDASGNPILTAANPGIVAGAKTNDAAAPGATNVGTLPAVATAAIQTVTEGNQVALSTDLSGRVRIISQPVEGTTGDTGVKTATFNGTTMRNPGHESLVFILKVLAASGTTPTLNAQFQVSPDGGGTFFSFGAASSNIVAAGQAICILVNGRGAGTPTGAGFVSISTVSILLPKTWRILYTIGGTTPSFTISLASTILI